MTSVITPRNGYIVLSRQFPLSEIITDTQELFGNRLNLASKSAEQTIANGRTHGFGTLLGYDDEHAERLFVYLGLVYRDNDERVYPESFFFGTDLNDEKMDVFLERIQTKVEYMDRKNVLNYTTKMEGNKILWAGSPLLNCVESHKASKKGLYTKLSSLGFGSDIDVLKKALDS